MAQHYTQFSYIFAFFSSRQRAIIADTILPFLPIASFFPDHLQSIGKDDCIVVLFIGEDKLSKHKLSLLSQYVEDVKLNLRVIVWGSHFGSLIKEFFEIQELIPTYLHTKQSSAAIFKVLEQLDTELPNG